MPLPPGAQPNPNLRGLMRFSLNLFIWFTVSCSAGVIPAHNQSLTVASGLPCRDGLNLWLCPWSGYWTDAGATPAASSSVIYQWNDLSGFTNHMMQPNSSLRGYINPVDWSLLLPFQGSAYYSNGISFSGSRRSYTFATSTRSFSLQYPGCSISASNKDPSILPNYGNICVSAQGNGLFQQNATNSTDVSQAVVFLTGSAVAQSLQYGPVTMSAGTNGATTWRGSQLGRYFDYGLSFNGKISQVLAWNRPLSATEISAVTRWLYDLNPHTTNYLRRIVCDGDSITAGYFATNVLTFPYQLQQLEGDKSRVFNSAHHGYKIGDCINNAANFVSPIYVSGLTNYCVLMIGINDLVSGSGNDGPTIYASMGTYLSARTATGFKSIIQTVLPFAGATVAQESNRVVLNSLILGNTSNWFAVVDPASDSHMTNPANTTYYLDGKHPTAAGFGVMASILNAALSGF